jgi:hypothetical protein
VPAFFLDTSTVLKRYVQETGTPWVQALTAPAAGHSLIIVRITLAETVTAITRKERGGSLTPKDAATALADFHLDVARQYFITSKSQPPWWPTPHRWRGNMPCEATTPCSSRRHSTPGLNSHR